MIQLSFMTANFVARELDWRMEDWSAGDASVNQAFRPLETYSERLAAVLDAARDLGFHAVDMWDAHLSATWATDEHVRIARDLLADRNMSVASLAGWFGTDRDQFTRHCEIAAALGAPILGGRTALLENDREWMTSTLERHGLRFGLENHPEGSPREILDRIGPSDAHIGATVDTGWFATQGYDAATAIEELGDRVVHVHLKDVVHASEPHETCGFGEGIVPLQECVDALRRIGYEGFVSLEHEPGDRDPSDEIRRAREQTQSWLDA